MARILARLMWLSIRLDWRILLCASIIPIVFIILGALNISQELGNRVIRLSELYAYCLQGVEEFSPTPGLSFLIPIPWLMMQVAIASLIAARYIGRNPYFDVQRMISSGHRAFCFFEEYIWCLLVLTSFYSSFFLSAIVLCNICSTFSASIDLNNVSYILSIKGAVTGTSFWTGIILQPVVSVTLSLIQVSMSKIFHAASGLLATAFYTAGSSYFGKGTFLCDCSMLKRALNTPSESLQRLWGIVALCFLALLLSAIACARIFKGDYR